LAEDKNLGMAQKFPFHVPAVKIETGRWLNGQADFLETSGVKQELNYSGQFVASIFLLAFYSPSFFEEGRYRGKKFRKKKGQHRMI
jgi:hypothetical protein